MSEINLAMLANARVQKQENPKQEELPSEIAQTEYTPEERKRIDEIKTSIDFMDTQTTVQYGIGVQRNMTEFADSILQNVRSKDGGQAGELLSELVVEIKSLDTGQFTDDIFSKIPVLKNATRSIKKLKERFSNAEVQIDRIEAELEKERMNMLRDIGVFDMMYQENIKCFRELELYIVAGRERIAEIREETLPKLRSEATASGNPMDAQLVSDFEDTVDRF